MDRITTKPLDGGSSNFTPAAGSSSWADEVASPTGQTPTVAAPSLNSVPNSQLDGAAEDQGGSGLHDTDYEVEVKLSDLQNQQDNPLYSVKSFEQLNM